MRAYLKIAVIFGFGFLFGLIAKEAFGRDAYTAATISCIERETAGKADEDINVDAVVLDCMEEAGPLDIPPIPRLPS